MLTQDDISRFYDDVAALGLKFPVAAIHKATGFGKPTVSQYLKKKLPPSENFITAFYKKFEDSLKNVSRGTQGQEKRAETKSPSLDELIQSNAALSRAQEKFADAHLLLAQDHHDLLTMFKTYLSSDETGGVSYPSAEREKYVHRKIPKVPSGKRGNRSTERIESKTGNVPETGK